MPNKEAKEKKSKADSKVAEKEKESDDSTTEKKKDPEPPGNLRRRGDWFQKRH